MSQRFNVLISAYACEPNKGSEPEVGWQWALQMARFHQVTVLTRSNNQAGIERGLAALPGGQPVPKFIYHESHPLWIEFKRRSQSIKPYYLAWQKSARKVIERLHQAHPYDLMHHVTFASYRYPVAIWGHGAPTIWGPVGGIESISAGLLPWRHPASLAPELLRNFNNFLHATPYYVLPRFAAATTLLLASTREMQQTFSKLGFAAELMPTIGLKTSELPTAPHRAPEGALKLLYVGNIITLKGIDLALHALKQSGSTATFTLVGRGKYLPAARRLVQKLGLQDRVFFSGPMPREQVLRLYSEYDVFVFPSLHDTGGYAVLEAMFNELPVICLDCGGPPLAVREGCGIRIPLGSRAEVVRQLAAAMQAYDQNRSMIVAHGQSARQVVFSDYDWDVKGKQMNARYKEAVARFGGEKLRSKLSPTADSS